MKKFTRLITAFLMLFHFTLWSQEIPEAHPSQYFVRLCSTTSPQAIQALLDELNSVEVWRHNDCNLRLWEVQSFPYLALDGTLVANINDHVTRSRDKTYIDDSVEDLLYQLNLDDANNSGGNYFDDLNLSAAQGNSPVKISIIDTGISDLTDNTSPNYNFGLSAYDGYDYIDGDNTPNDLNGHGSHIAGLIHHIVNLDGGASNISFDIRKAYDANGFGTISDIVRATINAVDDGADLINMSFSYLDTDRSALFNPVKEAVRYAKDNNVLIVASAGNNGLDNDNSPYAAYPASLPYPNIISVASNKDNKHPSNFSNYGANTVDVSILGEKIPGPDLGRGVSKRKGTSFSTAIVTALAAIIGTRQSEFDYNAIKCQLITASEAISQQNGKNKAGGVVDFQAALLEAGPCGEAPVAYFPEPNLICAGNETTLSAESFHQLEGVVENVIDHFDVNGSFAGNNGDQNWSNDWQEMGESNGPGSGFVRVTSNALRIGGYSDDDDDESSMTGRGAWREVNLSEASSATLSLDFSEFGSNGFNVTLAISGDGGSSWNNLETFTFSTFNVSRSYDISAYVSANTRIRMLANGYIPEESTRQMHFDNIKIEYTANSGRQFTYDWIFLDDATPSSATGESVSPTWSSSGNKTVQLTVTASDGSSDTFVASLSVDEGAECVITPSETLSLETAVSSGNDDVEERENNGSIYPNSTDLELVKDGARGNQPIGLRFNNIAIPPGAYVQHAYIQFTVDETSSGNAPLLIQGHASDNAPPFTTAAYNVSSRSRTSASVNWNPPAWNALNAAGTDQRTTDISAVIQDIVNRSGWNAGNSIAIILTGSGRRVAKSYEGSPSQAAVLHIEYSEGELGHCPGGDADADGVCDNADICPGGNDNMDADLDGTPDACDSCPDSASGDSDGDGVCDNVDICPGGNDALDADLDGIPDDCDSCPYAASGDADGDGVCDNADICPGGDDSIDSDQDGAPDFCDDCDNNLIGTPCDDGDPETNNDVINANCNCAGTSNSLLVFDAKVSGGDDDVEQLVNSGSINFTSSDLDVFTGAVQNDPIEPLPVDKIPVVQQNAIIPVSELQTVGLRFNDITIPPGAIVQNAYVQFTANEVSTGKAVMYIRGEASDDSSPFQNIAHNVSSRALTSAAVNWYPTDWNVAGERGAGQRTADISSIIQEIVNRPGWSSGQSITIIIIGKGKRTATSYNGSPTDAPSLHFEYVSGSPDNCPSAGTPCDDGDPCTTNDVYDANCNCAGVYQDNDNDGYCIGDDPDDNDACTPDNSSQACNPCSDLYFDDFENGWGTWNDGGIDSRLSAKYTQSGRKSLRLRDNSGAASSAFTDKLDLRDFQSVEISFSYYPFSFDGPKEDFWLQLSTDNGATYTTIEEWNRGDEFENGRWYQDQVIVSGMTFSANTRFRFICDASGDQDQVYIDDISIRGCNTSGNQNARIQISEAESVPAVLPFEPYARLASIDEGSSIKEKGGAIAPPEKTVQNQIGVSEFVEAGNQFTAPNRLKATTSPNPFQHEFRLFLERPDADIQEATISVMDINGRVIYQETRVPFEQDHLVIAESGWPDGLYLVRVQAGEYLQTIKLIRQN